MVEALPRRKNQAAPRSTPGLQMQLSYAQNLEDLHLEMIFSDVADGTYVDVGGGHPVADNVTFYFYLKGWRGLVIEPQETLAGAYALVRPRDHVVSCLAGAHDGTVAFHTVEGLHGLSSAVKANAESAAQYGARFTTTDKRVRRLSALIDEAKLAAIDVLKIDVEGAEADVLAGLDLARHRPKVILVETINPNNPDAAVGAWEPALTTAGYRFVFFDNLNRFYLAGEHEALASRFPATPIAWDKVGHLWDRGRAAERRDHPDRRLAELLVAGLFATLTERSTTDLARLIERGARALPLKATDDLAEALAGTAEWPRASRGPTSSQDLDTLLSRDDVRAALGRIACMYDGGHLLE
jgi:FkbM family methyltransferase